MERDEDEAEIKCEAIVVKMTGGPSMVVQEAEIEGGKK